MTNIKEIYSLSEEEIDEKANTISENLSELIEEYAEGEITSEELIDTLVDKIDEGGVELVMTTITLRELSEVESEILFDKYPDIIEKLMLDEETIYLTKNILHEIASNYDFTESTEELADDLHEISDSIFDYYDDFIRDYHNGDIPRGGATMLELGHYLEENQDEFNLSRKTLFLYNISQVLESHISFFLDDGNHENPGDLVKDLWEKKEDEETPLKWGIDSNNDISNEKKSQTYSGGIEYEDVDAFQSRLIISFNVAYMITRVENSPEGILRIESSLVEYLNH